VAEGFKMGAAFVDVTVDDNTKEGREGIGSKMVAWAGGLALGGIISKGIADNLEIDTSVSKLGAQLDLTKGVSEAAGKVAGEVYRDNFGESIPAVNAAIASVGQNLVDLNTVGSGELKDITEAALGIADVFDQDVNEVIRAAGQLVKNNLAPDVDAAMDIITRGFQSGGNIAGDLLETINEYSPQFAKLGFDGATAIGILVQGLQAGARDGDVMADVFKEFGLRAIDTAVLTTEGYQMIGLNADEMRAKVAAGGQGASDAMLQVLTSLQAMQDPVAQNAAGVALFGTQWEDTLRQILPSMDLTQAALSDVEGATARMNEQMGDNGAAKVESVKRSMEGWITTMTGMEGPLGSISAWVVGFAPAALPMISQVAMIGSSFATMGLFAEGGALRVVGGWIAMGAASVANAIKMAASWVLAFWPVALIIAAVIALTALVIMNWDTISSWTTKTWNAIWKFVSDIITKVARWVGDRINDVVGFFQMLSRIPGNVANWFNQIRLSAIQKLVELVNWVRGLPGRILGALGDLGRLLFNAGKSILEGLWNGLKSAWNKVKEWVGNVGGWIADLKGPIEVDMVLLVPQGNAIMRGLGAGLNAGFTNEVKPLVAGMADELAGTEWTVGPPTFATPVGGDGAATPTGSDGRGTIIIENLTVTFPGSLNAMNRTELREVGETIRDEIRKIEREERTA
jgi:phage-related minor tail protein